MTLLGSSCSCAGCSAMFQAKIPTPFDYVCPVCFTDNRFSPGFSTNMGRTEGIVEDLTPLFVGAKCEWKNMPYEVIGRLRIEYEEGYYRNQWILSDPQYHLKWLLESVGMYALVDFYSVKLTPETLKGRDVGTSFPVNNLHFYFDAIAEINSFTREGQTPFIGELRKGTLSLDLSTSDNGWAIIDVFSQTNSHAYFGEVVELVDLKFEKLRNLDGWSN